MPDLESIQHWYVGNDLIADEYFCISVCRPPLHELHLLRDNMLRPNARQLDEVQLQHDDIGTMFSYRRVVASVLIQPQ